jgi:hypothetical protein
MDVQQQTFCWFYNLQAQGFQFLDAELQLGSANEEKKK